MYFYQFLQNALSRRRKTRNQAKTLLVLIQNSNRNWGIRSNFEMIALLIGLQRGHILVFCLWNNSADEQHYEVEKFQVLIRSNTHFSSKEAKFCFRHYTSNLDLAKQFIKALKFASPVYQHVRSIFPKLTLKSIGGIFVGP